MKWTNRLGKWLFVGGAWSATALMLGAAGTGCLSRPVGQQPPTTKVNFTSTVSQQAVDKVDLLFAIDNSASMGDKQAILADAVPDLINGLLSPRCVDIGGQARAGRRDRRSRGQQGEPLQLPAEHRAGVQAGQRHAHRRRVVVARQLRRRRLPGDATAHQRPRSPPQHQSRRRRDRAREARQLPRVVPPGEGEQRPEAASAAGEADPHDRRPRGPRRELQEDGRWRGPERLRSRGSARERLPLPHPAGPVEGPSSSTARTRPTWAKSVDIEVLQQRADFLRPDSLVAIIMLTDEDDSSADPLAIGGQGWAFMAKNFPGSKVFRGGTGQGTTAPRGTTACEKDPGSEDCTSCGFQSLCDKSQPSCQKIIAGQELHDLRVREGPAGRRLQRLLRAEGRRAQRALPPHEGALRHRSPVPDQALRRRLHEVQGAGPQGRARDEGLRGATRHRELHEHRQVHEPALRLQAPERAG